MPKKIDWDGVTREQRAQRNGSASVFDELPPVGSYADRARYISVKPEKSASKEKRHAKAKTSPKKAKRSHDERLHNLQKTLKELITIPSTSRWSSKGLIYKQRLLAQISATLRTLIKLDPSSSSEHHSLEATRLLTEHSALLPSKK